MQRVARPPACYTHTDGPRSVTRRLGLFSKLTFRFCTFFYYTWLDVLLSFRLCPATSLWRLATTFQIQIWEEGSRRLYDADEPVSLTRRLLVRPPHLLFSTGVSRNTAPRAPRTPPWKTMVLGLLLNKQQNKQVTLNRWRGRTDEGAIRPVTRRARLLPERCARCTRCGVSWHRPKNQSYTFRNEILTGEGVFHAVENDCDGFRSVQALLSDNCMQLLIVLNHICYITTKFIGTN